MEKDLVSFSCLQAGFPPFSLLFFLNSSTNSVSGIQRGIAFQWYDTKEKIALFGCEAHTTKATAEETENSPMVPHIASARSLIRLL